MGMICCHDMFTGAQIYCGDCREVLPELPEPVDAVVCDPPYGLSFMGKGWDRGVPGVEFWQAVIEAMKPGAHLLAFGGTRTFHRLTCAIEDAGFEIRDCLMWVYGCLSEDTEILVDGRWEPYHKAIAGRRALCYDTEHDTYSWQPIEDLFVYDYADTAYRIISDSTDQIVSRNHRCLIEQDGGFVFQFAETLEREAHIPVLEDLPGLLRGLPVLDEGAGSQESLLLAAVHSKVREKTQAAIGAQGPVDSMYGLREEKVEAGLLDQENQSIDMLPPVQWSTSRQGIDQARAQGAVDVDSGIKGILLGEDERAEQPSLEGRRNVFPQARELQADQVCSLPAQFLEDGPQGWLRDGASADRGSSDGAMPEAHRSRPPHQSRSARQPSEESGTVQQQSRPQTVRGARYTRTDLARVEPIHYVGKVWCVKVPTGAFVARRNGKVFVTGNSGFPKSHNVGNAIDKAQGKANRGSAIASGSKFHPTTGEARRPGDALPKYEGRTEEGKKREGFGTALKPAWEPIILARRPLSEKNMAANILRHGVGALNIDGCRIPTEDKLGGGAEKGITGEGKHEGWKRPWMNDEDAIERHAARVRDNVLKAESLGRWPANVIHDGSQEVFEFFPKTTGGDKRGKGQGKRSGGFVDVGSDRGDSEPCGQLYNDEGSAARFFYCAKTSKRERGEGNDHPTVKPIALMRYLCRLVTPPGGIVLDPFMGSGSTLLAAYREGFRSIGVELEAKYCDIAWKRIAEEVSDVTQRKGGETK